MWSTSLRLKLKLGVHVSQSPMPIAVDVNESVGNVRSTCGRPGYCRCVARAVALRGVAESDATTEKAVEPPIRPVSVVLDPTGITDPGACRAAPVDPGAEIHVVVE